MLEGVKDEEGFELTGDINITVAAVSVQVVIGEAGASHEPRSFANDLGAIAVGVTVDTIEHLAIAAKT